MLEGRLSEGKVYFLPNSIGEIKIVPISYWKGEWRVILIDINGEEHPVIEAKLKECGEYISNMSVLKGE